MSLLFTYENQNCIATIITLAIIYQHDKSLLVKNKYYVNLLLIINVKLI